MRAGRKATWAAGVALGVVVAALAQAPVRAEVALEPVDERVELPHDEPPPRVVDPAPVAPAMPVVGALAEGPVHAPPPAPFPHTETFQLQSLPGSQRTIFLDFRGGTIAGTAWNGDPVYETSASFVAEPFSLDDDPAFSGLEHDIVQDVWRRVAEDYAPFDVNVTTRDLGAEAIDRTSTTDTRFGTAVMVSSTAHISARCTCSGLAYIGVFDWDAEGHDFYQPAWVFPHKVGNDAKDIADVASHEAGHTLGLDHDGHPEANPPSYYRGHGSWGPIMGAPFTRPLSQLSRGDYPGATLGANQADPDDLAVIAANGAPLRADDHGGSLAQSSVLAGTGPFAAAGVIGTDADVDIFTVTVPSGTLSFTVDPAPAGPNLDVRLELRGPGGTIVVDDPPVAEVDEWSVTGLGATVTATVPAGTYAVLVEGVGWGTPSTGYSGYGSLGAFTLSGSFEPGPAPPPPPPPPSACAPLDLGCLVGDLLGGLDLSGLGLGGLGL